MISQNLGKNGENKCIINKQHLCKLKLRKPGIHTQSWCKEPNDFAWSLTPNHQAKLILSKLAIHSELVNDNIPEFPSTVWKGLFHFRSDSV